jgi:hypothetical protein
VISVGYLYQNIPSGIAVVALIVALKAAKAQPPPPCVPVAQAHRDRGHVSVSDRWAENPYMPWLNPARMAQFQRMSGARRHEMFQAHQDLPIKDRSSDGQQRLAVITTTDVRGDDSLRLEA